MKKIKSLLKKLTGKRRAFLFPCCDKAIETMLRLLDRKTILIQDRKGYEVIEKFKNNAGKIDIIGYCRANKLERALCPGYIRIMAGAVSIEVERWKMEQ